MNEENLLSKKPKNKNPSKRKFIPPTRRQENISPKKYSKTKTRKNMSEISSNSLVATSDNLNNNNANTNLKSNTQFNMSSNLDINSNPKFLLRNKPKNANKVHKVNKYLLNTNNNINNNTFESKTNNNTSKEYEILNNNNNNTKNSNANNNIINNANNIHISYINNKYQNNINNFNKVSGPFFNEIPYDSILSIPKTNIYNKNTNVNTNSNFSNNNLLGTFLDTNIDQQHNFKRHTDGLYQRNIPLGIENEQFGDNYNNNFLIYINHNNSNNNNKFFQEESKIDSSKVKLISSSNVLRQNDTNMLFNNRNEIETKPSKKKMTDTEIANKHLESMNIKFQPFIFKPLTNENYTNNNEINDKTSFQKNKDNRKYYNSTNDEINNNNNRDLFFSDHGDINSNNNNIKKTRSKAKTKTEEKNEDSEIEIIRIVQGKPNNYFYNNNSNNNLNCIDYLINNNALYGIKYCNYLTEENQKNNGIISNDNVNNYPIQYKDNQNKLNINNEILSQTEKRNNKVSKIPSNKNSSLSNNIIMDNNNFNYFDFTNNLFGSSGNNNINSIKNLNVVNSMSNLNNTNNNNFNQSTPNVNEIKKNHTNSKKFLNNSSAKNINNNINANNLIGKIMIRNKLLANNNNPNNNNNNNSNIINEVNIINKVSVDSKQKLIKQDSNKENDFFLEKMNTKKNNNKNDKHIEEPTENSLENSSSLKIISYHEDQIEKISSKKVTLNNEKSNDEEESEIIPQVSEFSKEYFNNNDPNKYNFVKNIYRNNFETGNYGSNSDNLTIKDTSLYSNFCIKGCKSLTQAGTERTGHRKKNQDNYIIEKNVNGIIGFNLFGILDGHGINGHYASEYVSKLIIKRFIDETNNFEDIESLYKEFKKSDFQKVIDIFLETDKQIIDQKRFDVSLSGTTCVLVIQLGDHVICANIGDSRAILIYGDSQIFELSHDSKPELPEETKRISMMGGMVGQREDSSGDKKGPYRVYIKNENEPGLAMSRSFGDKKAKSCGVIPYPDIIEYTVDNCSKYMVICSDGVWEFLSNQDVMNIGDKYYNKNNINGFCQELLKRATDKWKQEDNVIDDITMIVVFF